MRRGYGMETSFLRYLSFFDRLGKIEDGFGTLICHRAFFNLSETDVSLKLQVSSFSIFHCAPLSNTERNPFGKIIFPRNET